MKDYSFSAALTASKISVLSWVELDSWLIVKILVERDIVHWLRIMVRARSSENGTVYKRLQFTVL